MRPPCAAGVLLGFGLLVASTPGASQERPRTPAEQPPPAAAAPSVAAPPSVSEPASTSPRPERGRRVDVGYGITLGIPPDTLSARLRAALDRAGVEGDRLGFEASTLGLWGGGDGRLPLFDLLMADPMRTPDMIRALGAGALSALGSANSASELMLFAGERAGYGVRRGLVASPHAGRWEATADVEALERAVKALRPDVAADQPAEKTKTKKKSKSKESKEKDTGDIRTRGDVPAGARHLAAFLVEAARSAIATREEAVAKLPREGGGLDSAFALILRTQVASDTAQGSDAERDARRAEALLDAIDLPLLHAGAMDLALALDEARAKAESLDLSGEYYLEATTPFGALIVDGNASTTYSDRGPYFLIIDAGGHDTYAGGAATLSPASPISLVLELGGDDQYVAADTTLPSWGGACLGYALLLDAAGNDTYRGGIVSQGAGIAGAGLLVDRSGNDRYTALAFAQGAGVYGIGALGDGGGSDRYIAFQAAQGFGGALGAGVLADSSGGDAYLADDTTIRFPSAQSAAHNTSLSQGFGMGKRADVTDGHSHAGGFGILADGEGDDTYRAGVFAQGAAYWYSVGALFDAGGNDSFDAVWYAQGAAAHFALGVLLDMDGRDSYRATDNMAQGAGHDFSAGILLDYGGDDRHESPNLSLGGGNANGLGIYFDADGHDTYVSEGATVFGRGNTSTPRGGLRDNFPTIGVFLDVGGRDDYPGANSLVGNAKSWRQEGVDQPPLTTEEGYGYDSN